MDELLLLPYRFTSMHIYAYFNYANHIKTAMKNRTPLIYSHSEKTPLSLAINRNLSEVVDNMLEELLKISEQDQFCLWVL